MLIIVIAYRAREMRVHNASVLLLAQYSPPKQIAAALITHKRRLIVTAETVSYLLLIIYTGVHALNAR